MSGPDDNFLARWARRKREVGAAEQEEERTLARDQAALASDGSLPPPLRGRAGEGGASEPPSPLPSPTPDPSPQGGGEAHPEPLPSLEALTAESDLSAFMRTGVPEALKKAAMRRMWSLDPAIRDHVGLAEYAWDFNNPGSMAGFGAVAAGTPMAQLAASVMSGQGSAAELSREPPVPPGLPQRSAAGPPPSLDQAGPSRADDCAVGPDDPGGAADPASVSAPAEVREAEDPGNRSHTREKPAPRHGGAMPR